MSSTIDWSKAPEWAGAVVAANSNKYWVVKYGSKSIRQNLDATYIDCTQADMTGDHLWTLVETRPTESPVWSGEGLPPVGTVCECQNDNFDWLQGTVVHVGVDRGSKLAIMQCEHEMLWGEAGEFRPIRTPEHIAAEEREKACEAMLEIAKSRRPDPDVYEAIATLYDAGYRKAEQP